MFHRIRIIGRGRVGSAFAARLTARGHTLDAGVDGVDDVDDMRATLVLLCVPDSAIADVARSIPQGPWIAHTSGATPLGALAPHATCFSVHPLQTFTRTRGAEQMDGAWAGITGGTPEALARAAWLTGELGLRPFELRDDRRALYHAGAAMASNYLVTLYRLASRALDTAGAPPEALLPLMRRTIDNGFELTGPIVRGDLATVDAHLAALREHLPEIEPVYRALAAATIP